MEYNTQKNWTAKQLDDSGKERFTIVVFGFEFKIIVDPDYNSQTCMYIDTRDPSSVLLFKAPEEVFRKISSLRKAIETDLNLIFNQIGDFKKDYKKASFKHFCYGSEPDILFNPVPDNQKYDILAYVDKHPSDINNYDPELFKDDTDLVIRTALELYSWGSFNSDIYPKYFSHFGSELAREIVIECLKLNEFQQQAILKSSNALDILSSLVVNEVEYA